MGNFWDRFLYAWLFDKKMHKKYRKGIFCVVYASKPVRYLLLHRKLHWKGWEFTKGGRLAREKIENTAKREVREETGLKALAIKQFPVRGSFIYDKKTQAERKFKGFRYVLFACNVKKGKIKLDKKEHDGFKWCSYSQALKLLKWPEQKRFLKIVNDAVKKH